MDTICYIHLFFFGTYYISDTALGTGGKILNLTGLYTQRANSLIKEIYLQTALVHSKRIRIFVQELLYLKENEKFNLLIF